MTSCYMERAAIMEYDGGLTREEAEKMAMKESVIGGNYKEGTVLFCCTDASDACVEAAKKYISAVKLTSDDVRIVKKTDEVLVIAKRQVSIE